MFQAKDGIPCAPLPHPWVPASTVQSCSINGVGEGIHESMTSLNRCKEKHEKRYKRYRAIV